MKLGLFGWLFWPFLARLEKNTAGDTSTLSSGARLAWERERTEGTTSQKERTITRE